MVSGTCTFTYSSRRLLTKTIVKRFKKGKKNINKDILESTRKRDQLTKFWKLEFRSLSTWEDGTPLACTEGSREASSFSLVSLGVCGITGISFTSDDRRVGGAKQKD